MKRLYTEKAKDRDLANNLKGLRQHDLDNEWLARGSSGGASSGGDSIVRIDTSGRAWVALTAEVWYCFTHTVASDAQPIFG